MTQAEPSSSPRADADPGNSLPRHVAIIMDGNGRWAQRRGLPRIEGHRHGVDTVRRTTEKCAALGIEALTLYCFSSENWKRPPVELDFLMHLLEQYLVEERRTLIDNGLRLNMIGRRDRLPAGVLRELEITQQLCADHTGMQLVLAVDYGGRAEIVDAVRQLAAKAQRGELQPDAIDEAMFSEHLYTAGLPDPDLLIRTGGDMRVSNYLLWQISYAELWVTDRSWPDFREEDLMQAIQDFSGRQRRFGGLVPG
ncbi:Decaprenyl diphosphate synthase-like protein [Rosistilla ulvae]|uniref:Isoprenyl transferase n=1 Tax=Rosistilla ulvae TaxID=1930277 RepID=A0A517M4Z9_9BACT|nr:isoprenyl transferase [Rosistilla ulvae]QDS89945.1 Decaprenyl diphosphate synthase-like protein [Rosistilla ulvae]